MIKLYSGFRLRFLAGCQLALLAGCSEATEMEFAAREYTGNTCVTCPSIRVAVPEAPDDRALGRVVNQGLREEVIYWLDYDDLAGATTIPEAIQAFEAGYDELRREFPDEVIGWEATIEGTVSYENDQLLSIRLEGYIFTGGAHGMASTRYLNFDKARASELDNRDLVRDLPGLEAVAEKAFREAQGIPMEAGINSTGFMFEDDRFSLPEYMGFAPEGLVLLYNPYEVASYADGAILLVLPYGIAGPYLNYR